MAKKLTFEEAVARYESKFQGKKLLTFNGVQQPCTILCPIHGEQQPKTYRSTMLSKNGCPICGEDSIPSEESSSARHSTKKLSFEEAAARYAEKFPGKKLLTFAGSKRPCRIFCNLHGESEVSSFKSLMDSKYGCPICSKERLSADAPPPPTPPRFAGFAERLVKSIEAKGMSLEKVAKSSFIPKERLEAYLKGHTLPYVEDGEHLANTLGIQPEWLRFGDTPYIPPIGSEVLVSDEPPSKDTRFMIPRYDTFLSAGEGNATWVEKPNDEDPLWFRHGWLKAKGLDRKNLKAMYVRGDSMEPVLNNWDTIVLDTSDTEPGHGQIYALFYRDNLYIKQIQINADGLVLFSYNPAYAPILVSHADADRLMVLGRMVWRGG
nr:MAG TPA: Repressor protein CI [Caudoviricetes sp.]